MNVRAAVAAALAVSVAACSTLPSPAADAELLTRTQTFARNPLQTTHLLEPYDVHTSADNDHIHIVVLDPKRCRQTSVQFPITWVLDGTGRPTVTGPDQCEDNHS